MNNLDLKNVLSEFVTEAKNLTDDLDFVSNIINDIEKNLQSINLNFAYKWTIRDDTYFHWALCPSAKKFRLFYEDKNIRKAFIETNINIRFKNSLDLHDFLLDFKDYIKEIRVDLQKTKGDLLNDEKEIEYVP